MFHWNGLGKCKHPQQCCPLLSLVGGKRREGSKVLFGVALKLYHFLCG